MAYNWLPQLWRTSFYWGDLLCKPLVLRTTCRDFTVVSLQHLLLSRRPLRNRYLRPNSWGPAWGKRFQFWSHTPKLLQNHRFSQHPRRKCTSNTCTYTYAYRYTIDMLVDQPNGCTYIYESLSTNMYANTYTYKCTCTYAYTYICISSGFIVCIQSVEDLGLQTGIAKAALNPQDCSGLGYSAPWPGFVQWILRQGARSRK